jgi:hypothetical protein
LFHFAKTTREFVEQKMLANEVPIKIKSSYHAMDNFIANPKANLHKRLYDPNLLLQELRLP